jgi:hypothetical protein
VAHSAMKKLRWKKWKPETGLKAVGESPYRSSDYHDGETVYATVSADGGGGARALAGWYFHGRIGTLRINTANDLVSTEAEARKKAEVWVRNALGKK